MLTAWGDESLSDRNVDPGRYIFGAVITDENTEQAARDNIRKLLLPGQKKTHWRDESDKRRDQIVEELIQTNLNGVVVTRVGPLEERDERRRRKCFEHFAMILDECGVENLVLESRGARNDALDLEMVRAIGVAKNIPTTFRVSHVKGANEPLLWAADAVCGAFVSQRTGRPKWMEIIERSFPIYIVGLPR